MKLEEKEDDGPRLNDSITAEYVRLVTDDGSFFFSSCFCWSSQLYRGFFVGVLFV